MYKKTILSFITAFSVIGALTAFAQTDTSADTTVSSPTITAPIIIRTDETPKTNMPMIVKPIISQVQAQKEMVVQIGPKGEVLLRGTLVSATAGAITVKSWGGVWTVNIPSAGAEILPAAVNNDVTKFVVGDFIGVQGFMSASESWTINAKVVRNREPASEKPGRGEEHILNGSDKNDSQMKDSKSGEMEQNKQQGTVQLQIQQILKQISELRARITGQTTPAPSTVSPQTTSSTSATE